jgi:hypothetical protein
MKKLVVLMVISMFAASFAHSFGLNDLKSKVDGSGNCSSNDQSCKNREKLKTAAKVGAVVLAAKAITDMVIEQRAKNISKEDKVAKEYKAKHNTLPDQPLALRYTTDTLPGKVVESGKKIIIRSDIVVVPGTQQKDTLIEERISIFDNEDHSKELNSLTKEVNGKTKRAGHYQNEFSFTLPKGLPQGVYPIKTALLLDGKVVENANNDIQLVLHIDSTGATELLAANF